MKQSPSLEADSRSASQEIPHLFCNLQAHYRIHNSPPLVRIPSQMTPVHTLTSHFFKIHFNIILPPTPKCTKCCHPLKFHDKNLAIYTTEVFRYIFTETIRTPVIFKSPGVT
jgi:hypothetical protein